MDARSLQSELEGYIGQTCELVGYGVELTLSEVELSSDDYFDRCALLFDGPPDPLMTQGTGRVRVGENEYELFLVPVVVAPNRGPCYESIVSSTRTGPAPDAVDSQ